MEPSGLCLYPVNQNSRGWLQRPLLTLVELGGRRYPIAPSSRNLASCSAL